MSKRVGILVGGGDVPGLNMCLKSLVYRLIDEGFEPIGIRKGWEGIISYNPADPTTYGANFIELTKNIVRPIDRAPGSYLHASRVDPVAVPRRLVPKFLRKDEAETQDLTEHIKSVIERLGYHSLVIIGDSGMLEYAAYLNQQDVPIIGIPKTVHNNIYGTDYTIGFSTALARGVAFIHELRALAGSREQIVVVETFGAHSGYSSLMTAFLAGADRALIPELPYNPEKLAVLTIRDKELNPSNYAVVTVCDESRIEDDKLLEYTPRLSPHSQSVALRQMTEEKARELGVDEEFTLEDVVETGSSLAGSGMIAAELLQQLTNEEVFLQPLTYLLRTGSPDGQDLLGATNYALLAARLVKQGNFGRMVAYQRQYNLTDIPLATVTEGIHTVDVDLMYDADNYRPKVDLIWAALES